MTEFDDKVERQRLLLKAEEWAKIPKSVHIHRLESMWYENEESKKFLENGNVVDISYHNGTTIRQQGGKTVYTFGKEITGDDLIRAYVRGGD